MARDSHVLWQCPMCGSLREYTKRQVQNRKRCPTCAEAVRSARTSSKRTDRQIREFWRAGVTCRSCGKPFWQPPTDGGYYKRCDRCRSARRQR